MASCCEPVLPLTGKVAAVAGNQSDPSPTAVRALDILGAFDPDHRRLCLSDLARRTGLPLTTTHRLVGHLVRWGALTRLASDEYEIGRRLWDIGLLAPVQASLRQVAAPFLHDIYGATGATVHLAVRDGRHTLYVDRISGHASAPVVSQVGSRLPLHATGVGKVLLAHAPNDVVGDVLRDLVRVTPYTITQPGRLAGELRRVRREGYATTAEEMSVGASSVAVPVSSPAGEVIAALGLVVADLRRHRPRFVAALRVAAQGIGRSLEP